MKLINDVIANELTKIAIDNREELENHFDIYCRQFIKTDYDEETNHITTIMISIKREFLGEEE